MKRTRTKSKQSFFPLRGLIESDVTSLNKYLKPIVRNLPLYELLCMCHPANRYDYARKLQKEGYVKENFVRKFKTNEKFELT